MRKFKIARKISEFTHCPIIEEMHSNKSLFMDFHSTEIIDSQKGLRKYKELMNHSISIYTQRSYLNSLIPIELYPKLERRAVSC